MRVLAITKIFPNSLEPLSSPFNRQQFAALAKRCDLTVIEAVPWFPLAARTGQPPRAAALAKLPARERVLGIDTFYMRQPYLPRVGIGLTLALPLYLAALAPYRRMAAEFDVVLATWAYPDGCAATLFAKALGKPVVVKVHGSDVNVLAQRRSARAAMRRVLPKADAVVAVSAPLGDALAKLGVMRSRVHLVKNGVDASVFHPRDRVAMRRSLGVREDGPLIAFCGRLEPQKGVVELLDAFDVLRRERPDARLVLLGEGVMRPEIDARVRKLGNGTTQTLMAPGARPLAEVAKWLGACDVFTLPSHAEGTPNVVLEALASGRPVVGSNVGGIPDCLRDPRTGIVVPARDASALATALGDALGRTWDEHAIVECGPGSWDESAAALHDVLASTLTARADLPRRSPARVMPPRVERVSADAS